MSFDKNFKWQEDCAPVVLRIANTYKGILVGDFAFRTATYEEDTKHSTDMVLEGKSCVAVRIRRDRRSDRDFTIRSRSRGGGKTEIDKLKDGSFAATYYLYIWEGDDGKFSEYLVLDMKKFIDAYKDHLENKPDIPNGDGTYFVAYSRWELDHAGCILAGRIGDTVYGAYVSLE